VQLEQRLQRGAHRRLIVDYQDLQHKDSPGLDICTTLATPTSPARAAARCAWARRRLRLTLLQIR
jgi:hypothetical protein